jgi:hypothetical protein
VLSIVIGSVENGSVEHASGISPESDNSSKGAQRMILTMARATLSIGTYVTGQVGSRPDFPGRAPFRDGLKRSPTSQGRCRAFEQIGPALLNVGNVGNVWRFG